MPIQSSPKTVEPTPAQTHPAAHKANLQNYELYRWLLFEPLHCACFVMQQSCPIQLTLLALNSLEAGAQIREPPKVWTASPTQHTSLDFAPLAPEVCSWVMEKMKVIPVRDLAQSICFGSAECHTAHRSHQKPSAHKNSCVLSLCSSCLHRGLSVQHFFFLSF